MMSLRPHGAILNAEQVKHSILSLNDVNLEFTFIDELLDFNSDDSKNMTITKCTIFSP